jgi:ribosomal protein L16 Arg81 hydroxylase
MASDLLFKKLVRQYRCHWFTHHFLGKKGADFFFKNSLEKSRASYFAEMRKKGPRKNAKTIAVEKDLSAEDFKEKYLKHNIPVIMKGAAKNWTCLKSWRPEVLIKNFGSDVVDLINASPGDHENLSYDLKQVTFGDVLEDITKEKPQYYSRFNQMLHFHPELVEDLDMEWMQKRRHWYGNGKTFQVFIGGTGTYTHLHSAAEHNLFVQVMGKKQWIMYPPEFSVFLRPLVTRNPYFHSAFHPDQPDYRKFPEMEFADRYEFELEEGDVFFNPPCWWHHVKNPQASIGVGFRWFEMITNLKSCPVQTLLTLCAVNPPIFYAMIHRSNFPKIFNYMAKRASKT